VISPPAFTLDDVEAANDAWGANCGPASLAVACALTLDEVRPHMGDFERKGYTNPTLMAAALDSVGRAWRAAGTDAWPRFGLVRIQWEGPWTAPGVPMRVRYRQTHWIVAALSASRGVGVFDVNAMVNGTGWCTVADWERVVVPFILDQYPRASGGWHRTHVWEVEVAA
jgi:hypothetical protein